MLPDYESLAFPPSIRAAAALCLAMKITDNTSWVSIPMVNSLNNLNSFIYSVVWCRRRSPLLHGETHLVIFHVQFTRSKHLAREIC